MRAFMDTSAWVALVVTQDGNHTRAVEAISGLRRKGAALFLSDYILDEAVTRVKALGWARKAAELGRLMQSAEYGDLRKVDAADFANAWRLFQKHTDINLSFTDCTILAQMDRLGIDTVFTFDKGFEAAGKQVVP